MHHLNQCASHSPEGRAGIECPFCKEWVFNPEATELPIGPALKWHCIKCSAKFTSLPPFEGSGESKESYLEKIINKLLEDGNCEKVVKLFAVASKRPPLFIEKELRNLLSTI